MEAAAQVRAATRDAVADVFPRRLRERLDARLETATMTPGVFVLESARAAAETGLDGHDSLHDRAAGVQLIYEGLALTRRLARSPPWSESASVESNVDVLVADVLVARGFYLLARTEAAPTAVETVRSFGYDETVAESAPETEPPDAALEIDVFELAIVAGSTAVGEDPPDGIRAFVSDLARSFRTNGSEPPSASTLEALAEFVAGTEGGDIPAEEYWTRVGQSDV